MFYIGGGLAAIDVIWCYYTTVENARIEEKRERTRESCERNGTVWQI